MGLSVAIAGGIVMFAMIYVMLTIPNMIDQTVSISRASSEMLEVESSILRTNMLVSSLVVTDSENGYVEINVQNTGTEKLWDFEKFDLLITYQIDAAPWNRTESLSYSGSCNPNPANGNWCKQSITNDVMDPDILNNGETLVAVAKVGQQIESGLLAVKLAADNGVAVDGTIMVP